MNSKTTATVIILGVVAILLWFVNRTGSFTLGPVQGPVLPPSGSVSVKVGGAPVTPVIANYDLLGPAINGSCPVGYTAIADEQGNLYCARVAPV